MTDAVLPSATLTATQVYALCCGGEDSSDEDDVDVQITHWPCDCPECGGPRDVVDIQDSPPPKQRTLERPQSCDGIQTAKNTETAAEIFEDGFGAPPVPDPTRGGQRRPRRRRYVVKAPARPGEVLPKEAGKRRKAMKTKTTSSKWIDRKLTPPARVVYRNKGLRGGYIMCPTFVCGASLKKSKSYSENLQRIAQLINGGRITRKLEAMARLAAMED